MYWLPLDLFNAPLWLGIDVAEDGESTYHPQQRRFCAQVGGCLHPGRQQRQQSGSIRACHRYRETRMALPPRRPVPFPPPVSPCIPVMPARIVGKDCQAQWCNLDLERERLEPCPVFTVGSKYAMKSGEVDAGFGYQCGEAVGVSFPEVMKPVPVWNPELNGRCWQYPALLI